MPRAKHTLMCFAGLGLRMLTVLQDGAFIQLEKYQKLTN